MDSNIITINQLSEENYLLKQELAKVKPLLLMGNKLIQTCYEILDNSESVETLEKLKDTLGYFEPEFNRKKVS